MGLSSKTYLSRRKVAKKRRRRLIRMRKPVKRNEHEKPFCKKRIGTFE